MNASSIEGLHRSLGRTGIIVFNETIVQTLALSTAVSNRHFEKIVILNEKNQMNGKIGKKFGDGDEEKVLNETGGTKR